MGDVLTFTLRPKPAAPVIPAPLTGPALRASLEEAVQTALDATDRIIAVLDRMDGHPDLKDGADDEPSLAAPENHKGSQVVWMRGNDADREDEAPETVLPEVAAEMQLEARSYLGAATGMSSPQPVHFWSTCWSAPDAAVHARP